MFQRVPCPPAPAPLEDYARHFNDLLDSLAQGRGFRAYLQGLLWPRDRNKPLNALAGTEPVVGAQQQEVQRLQFFRSESPWNHEVVNTRRLEALQSEPATQAHEGGGVQPVSVGVLREASELATDAALASQVFSTLSYQAGTCSLAFFHRNRLLPGGVLVIDETGDRNDGAHTAHVSRQYLGSIGKTDNGIVAVSSLCADEHVYYPLHVQPDPPAPRLPRGKADRTFRTKPQIAVDLVDAALEAGVCFCAVVADCLYGDNPTFAGSLAEAGVPFVLDVKPSMITWAPADAVHNPDEAVTQLAWNGSYGRDKSRRMVVATTDPSTLPDLTTWYLTTNLPHPERDDLDDIPFPPADLADVVRLDALRNWVE